MMRWPSVQFFFVQKIFSTQGFRPRSRRNKPILELHSAKKANFVEKIFNFSTLEHGKSTKFLMMRWSSVQFFFVQKIFSTQGFWPRSRQNKPILELHSAKKANFVDKIFNPSALEHSESTKFLMMCWPSVQFFFVQKIFSTQAFLPRIRQ